MIGKNRHALVVVDIQYDFCPGGSLSVHNGDSIIPVINKLTGFFTGKHLPVVFSRDFHPISHISFEEQGGPWPPHCVMDTKGAKFHPLLNIPEGSIIISKGTEKEKDAYSAFDGTNLSRLLRENGTDSIAVCGLATDYCVKATALDGIKEGFRVVVVTDATMGVEIIPGDSAKALEAMKRSGAGLYSSDELVKHVDTGNLY